MRTGPQEIGNDLDMISVLRRHGRNDPEKVPFGSVRPSVEVSIVTQVGAPKTFCLAL